MIRYGVDAYQDDGQRVLSHHIFALDDEEAIRQAARHRLPENAAYIMVRRVTNEIRYEVIYDSRGATQDR